MEYCIYTYLKTLAKFEPHNNYRTRLSPMHGKNKSHTKHKTLKSHVFGMVLLIQESPVVGKVLFLVCQSFSHLHKSLFSFTQFTLFEFVIDLSKIHCIKYTKTYLFSLKYIKYPWYFFVITYNAWILIKNKLTVQCRVKFTKLVYLIRQI